MPDDDWKRIDDEMKKRTAMVQKNDSESSALASPVPRNLMRRDLPKEDMGMLERYQTNKIEKKARVAATRAQLDAELSLWKHQIEAVLVIAMEEVDLRLEEQLSYISSRHIENLRTLGISNLEKRADALRQLNAVSARVLREVQDDDVPQMMKARVTAAVLSNYERLAEDFSREEVRKPTEKIPKK